MHKPKPYECPVCGAEVPNRPMQVPKHQLSHARPRPLATGHVEDRSERDKVKGNAEKRGSKRERGMMATSINIAQMWTLNEDRESVKLRVPPLPLHGLPEPLRVTLDFVADKRSNRSDCRRVPSCSHAADSLPGTGFYTARSSASPAGFGAS